MNAGSRSLAGIVAILFLISSTFSVSLVFPVDAVRSPAVVGAQCTPSSSVALGTPKVSPNALPKVITSISPDLVAGVVKGAGGIFFEDFSTGSLCHWDSTNGLTLVTAAPAGGVQDGYIGLATKSTAAGLRVALISEAVANPGLYFCDGATAIGVASCSPFIPLNVDFCMVIMPQKSCTPRELAFDSKNNLYYTDAANDVEVELTAASGYTSASIFMTFPPGNGPTGLFIDLATGTHYVSDGLCAGNIFANGALIGSVGNGTLSLTVSKMNPLGTKHIYVGVYALACGGSPNEYYVLDFTDGKKLPSSASGGILGLSTNLYFSSFFDGNILKTKDQV